MIEEIEDIEQCYSSFLHAESKEEYEKAISDLFSDLESLDAYNLLV